jgi:hypothetical protein
MSVKMGTEATIMDALDPVVYCSPVFSKRKYSTMPKKADAGMIRKCLRRTPLKDLVENSQTSDVTDAMICRKNAMETGGSCVRTILVLIKEYPQKRTDKSKKETAKTERLEFFVRMAKTIYLTFREDHTTILFHIIWENKYF